jgi:hypothetical protein
MKIKKLPCFFHFRIHFPKQIQLLDIEKDSSNSKGWDEGPEYVVPMPTNIKMLND